MFGGDWIMVNSEITKRIFKKLNIIKERLGITAFEDLMQEFFKISEENNTVRKSRDKWRARCEKAEQELKELKK